METKKSCCSSCGGDITSLYGLPSCVDCGLIVNQRKAKKEYLEELKEFEEANKQKLTELKTGEVK